jgi:2-phosphoglycerate kinase
LESSRTRVSSRYKAKYVNGMKMFMAFISSTANKMNITIAKNNALNGVVAELTW